MLETIGNYYGTDWLAMIMTFFSLYYLGRKEKKGFVFGLIACICWFIFGILAHSLANPIANVVFAYLNVKGLNNWQKDIST